MQCLLIGVMVEGVGTLMGAMAFDTRRHLYPLADVQALET